MYNVKLPSGHSFVAEGGRNLVEAAEAAGIVLPYSCRAGRCSTCRLRVRSGSTVAQMDEMGLTLEEKAEGWVLSCVREATSDVELDIEDLIGIELPPPRTLPCRIQSIEELAPDVRGFVLRLPPANNFTFLPGQYVEIIGPGGKRRSYSLASADSAQDHLELHVRRVRDGAMSEYWFEKVKPNDLLRLHGPLGTFFLRDVAGKELVFLATGTGIAPIMAMLEQLAVLPPENRPASTHVFWGGRSETDLYLDPRSAYPDLNYVPTLSRAPQSWKGSRLYVQDALCEASVKIRHAKVYACGSKVMIHDARNKLTMAGLPAASFFSDAFVCSS